MGRKSKRKNKGHQQKLERMFEDEEDLMTDMTSEIRKGVKEHSKISKKQRKKMLRQMMNLNLKGKQIQNSGSWAGWHKILIKGDEPLEKEFVLSSIYNVIDTEFHPMGYCRVDDCSCFFLENNKVAAEAIAGLDKRLQGPSGCRLNIKLSKCEVPDLLLNSDQLQVMRQCLSCRYNKDTCLLDLTNLHNDPLLKEKDILTPLQNTMIMKQILKLVKENIPELKALSLSKNSLRREHLKALEVLQSGSSHLAALDLQHNKIANLKVLSMIKEFPLTELNMQFNPVVETFKDKPLCYVKEVRARLASLKVLDTIDIDRYLAENNKPSHKANINFSHNEKIMCGTSSDNKFEVTDDTVRMFLDEYYKLIDTPERTSLAAAYTPDAVLEVKSNVQFINNSVFVGHEKIREAMAMLPASQHDHSSFSLHIQPLGPKTTRAEVTGQCQLSGINGLVAFLRIMNIVPFNTGFCCSQDTLELKVIAT